MVNAPLTLVSGVAHGINIMLGEWQDKTNLTVALLDLFDIILGNKLFQECHTVIDAYLQRLMVMEKGGTCMVPIVNARKQKVLSD